MKVQLNKIPYVSKPVTKGFSFLQLKPDAFVRESLRDKLLKLGYDAYWDKLIEFNKTDPEAVNYIINSKVETEQRFSDWDIPDIIKAFKKDRTKTFELLEEKMLLLEYSKINEDYRGSGDIAAIVLKVVDLQNYKFCKKHLDIISENIDTESFVSFEKNDLKNTYELKSYTPNITKIVNFSKFGNILSRETFAILTGLQNPASELRLRGLLFAKYFPRTMAYIGNRL